MFADIVELPHTAEDDEGFTYYINRSEITGFSKNSNQQRITIEFTNGADAAYTFSNLEELNLACNRLRGQ